MRANRRVQAHSDRHSHKLIEILLTPPGEVITEVDTRVACRFWIDL